MKKEFIINELFTLTIGGAFQRAKIYKETASEKGKVKFKSGLKVYLNTVLLPKYQNPVSDERIHIANIKALCNCSKDFEDILNNGQINFGVSQKLLNLYLKYQWCLDRIPEPPHFPVDRIIQEKLKLDVVPWTRMVDEKPYLAILNAARAIAKERNMSLAELELDLFNRRNSNFNS